MFAGAPRLLHPSPSPSSPAHPLSSSVHQHVEPDAGSTRPSPLAFAFDIDGVLLRDAVVLPEAKRALASPDGANALGVKIPYILITPANLIQAHTILKSHTHEYADKNVLVLGGRRDVLRKVAEGCVYGLKNVYTTLDVKSWNPNVWPFYDLTPSEVASIKPEDFSTTPIGEIFVFHDPRNWALGIQIMSDVILSRGLIGTPYTSPEDGKEGVKVVFCNPDLVWRGGFERSRLGQGAFREAFQAVFTALTGKPYPHLQYGKPTTATYDFASELLQRSISEAYGEPAARQANLYMVGDNLESDITGENAAGWSSVLVHTSVYDPASGPPAHAPTHEAPDVEAAVRWAVERDAVRARASG
ncbi:HAD-superfamily subfamily IIA hydrolase [Auriscalpium vulgare]|uniref:HAD-superfamily subfamily IIA hydrolase n=1 Tax=Auriscalpium vulgare TaxID=40419 RepID=A0ACB8RU98_9AGAM|nr:HAD-superfamily subfamily IIA hydrolase [Auriscalpium vulgare]